MLCTCIRGEGVSCSVLVYVVREYPCSVLVWIEGVPMQVCLFGHLIPLLHVRPLEPISSKYIIMKNMSYVPIHISHYSHTSNDCWLVEETQVEVDIKMKHHYIFYI